MNGQRRQDQWQSPHVPTGDMRRADGPGVRLGRGPRRVTGNDLVLVRALVSGNDQTIDDLSALRAAGPDAARPDAARRTGRRYVTECWLDRADGQLRRWLDRCAKAAVQQVGRAMGVGRPPEPLKPTPPATAPTDRSAGRSDFTIGFARRRQAA